jgi:signal transduction histidine kinase
MRKQYFQNDILLTPSFLKQAPGTSGNVELQIITRRGEVKDIAAKLRSFEHDGKMLLVGVSRDVSEQKRNAKDLSLALEYLSNQKDKVQALNEKLKVVGGLTRHDVRNQLMVANNNAYLLRKRIANQLDLVKYLEGIESAIKQCEKLFEFSRLIEKIGVEEPSEVNVEDCFNQAAGIMAKTEVTVINNCSGLTVVADRMLTQLFYNLIDNSQKHGGSISQITLYYIVDTGKTILYYEDNGVGIPEGDKERIFSEGYTTGGSGLGLKLVKKMIESYGWTIQENGTPGKGARFQITIPTNNSTSNEQKISVFANLETESTPNNLSKANRNNSFN